jgi:hypothetical protein
LRCGDWFGFFFFRIQLEKKTHANHQYEKCHAQEHCCSSDSMIAKNNSCAETTEEPEEKNEYQSAGMKTALLLAARATITKPTCVKYETQRIRDLTAIWAFSHDNYFCRTLKLRHALASAQQAV